MEQLSFPDALVPNILAQFQEFGAQPMPNQPMMEQMIRLAYVASLEREEGRPVQLSLGLLTNQLLQPVPGDGWSPFRFEVPRLATVSEIVRVAPATNPQQTLIGLTFESGNLWISGLVRTNRDAYRFARNESSSAHSVMLWYPRVTATSPGTLNIGLHESVLVRFARGVQVDLGTNVLVHRGPIHDQLLGHANDQYSKDLGSNPRTLYHKVVGQMLRQIVDARHGGTLVIWPSTSPPSSEVIRFKYSTNSADLKAQFGMYARAHFKKGRAVSAAAAPNEDPEARAMAYQVESRHFQSWAHHESRMADALSAVADLSQVDGALVLGPDLSVLGFGAMFPSLDAAVPARCARDALGQQLGEIDLSAHGARHRSAASFCYANSNTIAFVASADGPLTAMVRPEGQSCLLVWEAVDLDWYPPKVPHKRQEAMAAFKAALDSE